MPTFYRTESNTFEVQYQRPYNECPWASQWFPTKAKALAMVRFYEECGSPSHLVEGAQ